MWQTMKQDVGKNNNSHVLTHIFESLKKKCKKLIKTQKSNAQHFVILEGSTSNQKAQQINKNILIMLLCI